MSEADKILEKIRKQKEKEGSEITEKFKAELIELQNKYNVELVGSLAYSPSGIFPFVKIVIKKEDGVSGITTEK
jgi:hypothetical protein